MTIGERIKKIRTEQGLSTYDLAKATGISQSSISKLENGNRKADNIILGKISEALKISMDRLIGESVSSLIENRLTEMNISLDDVAQKARVPVKWLSEIDSFVPGEMEFMIDENPHELDWNDTIGEYTSYKWITQVADVLGIPGSLLRSALARQETPLDSAPHLITAQEAFGFSKNPDTFSQPEIDHIKKYRTLDPTGQSHVDTVLDWEAARSADLIRKDARITELENSPATRLWAYYGQIACAGSGFIFDDIPTALIEAPPADADFIIGVNGDSMEPDYHDGEKLYVKKTERIRYGEAGIFTIRNECFLKEYGEAGLVSRNPRYADIPGDEDVRLIGKVVGKVEE